MVALTKDTIRILAAFQSADAPVVSLYLDVDGRHRPRPQEYERQLDRMVRDAMSSFDGGRPAAKDLGFFSKTGERFYRFTLETTGGLVPARHDPQSRDTRDLGVFLDFTPWGL